MAAKRRPKAMVTLGKGFAMNEHPTNTIEVDATTQAVIEEHSDAIVRILDELDNEIEYLNNEILDRRESVESGLEPHVRVEVELELARYESLKEELQGKARVVLEECEV